MFDNVIHKAVVHSNSSALHHREGVENGATKKQFVRHSDLISSFPTLLLRYQEICSLFHMCFFLLFYSWFVTFLGVIVFVV